MAWMTVVYLTPEFGVKILGMGTNNSQERQKHYKTQELMKQRKESPSFSLSFGHCNLLCKCKAMDTESTQATELYTPDHKKCSLTSLVWTSLLSWLTFLLFPLFSLLNHALLHLPSIYSSSSSSYFNFKPLPVVELTTTTTTTTDQQQDLPPQTAEVVSNNDEVKQDDYEDQKIKKLTVVLDLDETLVCAYETSSLPDIIRNRAIESGLKWFDLECLSLEKESDGKPKVNHVTVFERPGLQEFLEKVSEFADLVLFTAGLESYARPLVDRIDVDNRFVSRLYRPSTTSTEYHEHVKDLLCVSKDLSRTVIVDNNPFSFVLQPRNGIPCIPFSAGQPYDVQLLEVLLPLLKRLSLQEDVRPALYNRFCMPEWFQQHGILNLDWSL